MTGELLALLVLGDTSGSATLCGALGWTSRPTSGLVAGGTEPIALAGFLEVRNAVAGELSCRTLVPLSSFRPGLNSELTAAIGSAGTLEVWKTFGKDAFCKILSRASFSKS
jgi:hypothetical protein